MNEPHRSPRRFWKKRLLPVAGVLLLVGVAGAGARFGHEGMGLAVGARLASVFQAAVSPSRAAAPSTLDLEPLIMNLADVDSFHYLRLTLTLELERPERVEQVRARLPLIQHALVVLVSSEESTVIRTAEGKARLRTAMTDELNKLLPGAGIRTVYFSEVFLQ